jgi:hypothetical protein
MYSVQYDMMQVTQNDMLRAAARAQLRSQARAARRARNQRRSARRLTSLLVLRGRRAAQAF